MGLANYIGATNVEKFSDLTRPLWNHMAEKKWFWNETLENHLNCVKKSIQGISERALFNPKEMITVQCDASGQGLGAVMLQKGKAVLFASRKLTRCEMNY